MKKDTKKTNIEEDQKTEELLVTLLDSMLRKETIDEIRKNIQDKLKSEELPYEKKSLQLMILGYSLALHSIEDQRGGIVGGILLKLKNEF